ncbi:pectate lyase [Rhizobium leguminosarum bv. trifolii]|uniref:Pectate lyase n=2 Tax=Rhizobium leguminosarum TaxID=384 RepID=A0A3E1B600_RHILT|nr:pectate lyase [Rhizobium leguminosarum]RFB86355.1 pectate lyase [Rhizobium leguminosarum bv. trifolii]RFB86613.1 pectate lyase [Rhizobium leguminosarum bv. trifolii]
MCGVDGQRPIDFDRTSRFDLESGCLGGSNRADTDFTAIRTRKVSPFEDFSGNPPMLTSYVPKSRETSENGTESDPKDVLRKHINWQSDSKKVDPSDEKQATTEKPHLSKEGSVIVVNEPIVVDGGVFDGKGATYTASSKLGDGGQSETQSPLFIFKNGATLKNVNLGENGTDGIHVYGGPTLENVNWQNVGEDALTVKSAGDVTIDGGAFSNGSNVFRTDSSLAGATFLSEITLDDVKNCTRVGDNQSGV